VIDLGPADTDVRRALAAAVVAAGLEPLSGDGVEDALGGEAVDRDALELAAELELAKDKFGELDCAAASAHALTAIGVCAARQASGLPVPELPRALEYVLACADQSGDTDLAITVATWSRGLGTDSDLVRKYPEVDTISNAGALEIDVAPELPSAAIWVDFRPHVGTHATLAPGLHVIAAGAGARRGVVSGRPIAGQNTIAIAMPDRGGKWAAVASRVASWRGKMPLPSELAWVLDRVQARAALVRHGDVVEAWGRAGRSEPPRRLGGDDGLRTLAEADRAAALVADRVQAWSSHAPDPDQPLLVETPRDRATRGGKEPTQWWVYATIGGALLAGLVVIYAHDRTGDTQRVELHYP
jgi:hypothetical protein